jgi:hypothetical protein
MALINTGVGVVAIPMKDESNSPANLKLFFDSTQVIADVRTAADAVYAALLDVSGCQLNGYSVNYPRRENAPRTALADSRVERKGVLRFRGANGFPAGFTIPSILPSLLYSSGRIDEDNTAVAALIALITGGIWTDSRGDDITTLDSAYERFRGSTKHSLPQDRKPDVGP